MEAIALIADIHANLLAADTLAATPAHAAAIKRLIP